MAKFNATRYLDEIFPGLARDGNGDVQVTAEQTIGMVPPGSILNSEVKARLDQKSQRRANDLLIAAEEHRLRGRELEARILANQAQFEVTARDLRDIDYGKEHEAKREELQRLRDEARILDSYLIEREQRERASWDAERAAREAANDAEDEARRTIATEHVSDFKEFQVQARLESSRRENPNLDSDATERIDTRLARGGDGSLQSNYLSNSSADATRRISVDEYVAALRSEAQVALNPAAKARYERQADFELEHSMLSAGATHNNEMSRLQVDQANADSLSSSLHKDSAHSRAERHSSDLAGLSAKGQAEHSSQLRKALAPNIQKAYDDGLGAHTAALKSELGEGYKVTAADVQNFETGFKHNVAEKLSARAAHQIAPQANAGSITSTEVSSNEHDLKVREIDGYKGEMAQDQKSVVYSDASSQEPSFRDEGARVRLIKGTRSADDRMNDIRAATKLAAEKYSSFSISGNDEFRERAAKVAGEMGFADRLSNPELRSIAKLEEERLKNLRAHPLASAQDQVAAAQSNQAKVHIPAMATDVSADLPSAAEPLNQGAVPRREDAAEELPSAGRSTVSSGHKGNQADDFELPSARRSGSSSRPEIETAYTTESGDFELPSARMSNARQTLQGLDAEQAASTDLPSASSDELTLEANQESQGLSRSL